MADVSTFICPSDLPNPIRSRGAQTNYMADMGSWIVWQAASGPNAGLPGPNGVFFGNSSTRFAAVTDGLSNTGFFSERVMADGSNAIVSPQSDVFFSPAAPTTVDDAVAALPGDRHHEPEQPVPAVHGLARGSTASTSSSTSWAPNSRSCGFFTALRAIMPPSSRHPGGVNLLLGDGSVRFIKDTVDVPTWRALGTISGGEVISADSF